MGKKDIEFEQTAFKQLRSPLKMLSESTAIAAAAAPIQRPQKLKNHWEEGGLSLIEDSVRAASALGSRAKHCHGGARSGARRRNSALSVSAPNAVAAAAAAPWRTAPSWH